jgi:hypothetical protein
MACILKEMIEPHLCGRGYPNPLNLIPISQLHGKMGWVTHLAEIDLMFRLLLGVLPRKLKSNDQMVLRTILLMLKTRFIQGWEEGVRIHTQG